MGITRLAQPRTAPPTYKDRIEIQKLFVLLIQIALFATNHINTLNMPASITDMFNNIFASDNRTNGHKQAPNGTTSAAPTKAPDPQADTAALHTQLEDFLQRARKANIQTGEEDELKEKGGDAWDLLDQKSVVRLMEQTQNETDGEEWDLMEEDLQELRKMLRLLKGC